MLHAPSLIIGAGITAIAILSSFFAFDMTKADVQLEMADDNQNPKKITKSVFLNNGSPIYGDPKAPITLVEFGDYQCFFCNKFFHNTEKEIVENYVKTGKVKMMFKDFTIIGPDSVTAAHAAHCANDQGMFWEYHDALYTNWDGENNGWASSENLFRFANGIGLDMEAFAECMNNSKHAGIIQASNNDAKTLGITGTPAFFVIGPNGQITKIEGAQPYEVFDRTFRSKLES